MLTITIPAREFYDELKDEFIHTKEQTLVLEHSLVSISKWESKWCKPFLSKEEKTQEQTIDYVRCMTITQNIDYNIYENLSDQNIKDVQKYIEAPMTATTFNTNDKKGPNREIITNELIYYWMVTFNIPHDCQKWHLNRLLTFINVCQLKNSPPKKMTKKELAARNAELNAQRRRELNTKG